MLKWRPLKRVGQLAPFVAAMIACAACTPMDFAQPTAPRPTEALFVPGIVAPDPALSPLVPVSPLPTPEIPVGTIAPDVVPTAEAAVAAPPAEAPPVEATAEPGAAPVLVSEPSLLGPTWEWVSSVFSDGLTLTTDDPARYTVQFAAGGNAMIQADCNFGSGLYEMTGDRVKFDAIGTTKMACPPESLDSEFLGQLYNLHRYELEDGELVFYLLEEAGTMRFWAAGGGVGEIAESSAAATATPQPAEPPAATAIGQSLASTQWAVTSLTIDGQPDALQEGSAITLIVSADGGTISGFTGCNQYRARLAFDEANLTVQAPALLARKICPSAIRLQEVEFLESLLAARSYVVQDGELLVLGADDTPLMTLSPGAS